MRSVKILYPLLLVPILLGVTLGCSHTAEYVEMGAPEKSLITLKDQVWIKSSENEPVLKKAGETIDVTSSPLFVEAPGKVGILVLPINNDNSNIELKLRPIENWAGDAAQVYAASILSDVLAKVTEIQGLMWSGRPREALTEVRTLQSQYPKVSYLKMIEASCLVMLGDRQNAQAILQSVLSEDPSNTHAETALRGLAGERSP